MLFQILLHSILAFAGTTMWRSGSRLFCSSSSQKCCSEGNNPIKLRRDALDAHQTKKIDTENHSIASQNHSSKK
jgi:hypothetical protein